MESPGKDLLKLLVERDPPSPEFRDGVRAALRSRETLENSPAAGEFDLWHDVFVHQPLPYGRFLQSALLHATAAALVWAVSLAWLRQQKILEHPTFDRSSLVTYTPEEYLPPLDTGASEAPRVSKGDPVYAKQPILSVPKEADNRSQTIVVPPDIKLDHDVPLPNIVATGAIVPSVPLDATRATNRIVAPEAQVVAPAPDVAFAANRVVNAARSDVIAPPPEVTSHQTRAMAGPETAVVEPPPELTQSTRGHLGPLNIGPSTVVGPAPVLTLTEQHTISGRGTGGVPGAGVQPVAPPPSVGSAGGSSAQGRLIALGIHPVAPTGPVAVPAGNRRGTFSAGPQGKAGAAGTPATSGSKPGGEGAGSHGNSSSGFNSRNNGNLPAGLHVGEANSNAISPIERNGHATSGMGGDGDGSDGTREIASRSTPAMGGRPGARVASPVADDKVTDVDRQVFGARRFYAMTLNMPNLNSSTGSWDIRFAELNGSHKEGELLAPVATETSDPGYPLELIRSNVHGMVTLYAVIRSDGHVDGIRVLYSPDDRLDAYAAKALARWRFLPAERAGKPVALEAVVKIPFRVRRNF
jgi:TonB family protein